MTPGVPGPSEWSPAGPSQLCILRPLIDAWNQRTGDSAVLGPEPLLREHRDDGRYERFVASPITLSRSRAPRWPLHLSCHARWPDGSDAASVVISAGSEDLAQDEVGVSIMAAFWDGVIARPGDLFFTMDHYGK